MTLLPHNTTHPSIGGTYSYRVLGPCCRLFDREELPWPSCSLAWRGKQPSWRRIGRRFVPDMAAKRCPSYAVELLTVDCKPAPTVITLYPYPLSKPVRDWWYSK
jgi:hypothetical protein